MKKYIIILVSLLNLNCSKILMDAPIEDTPIENFNSMWNTLNEKYSFFEEKNIDWDKIREKYIGRINSNMSVVDLSNVLGDMLYELKDGHVNLYTGYNISRNWDWYLNYPENFNPEVIERYYLGKNHLISGGIRTNIIKIKDEKNIGYLRYGSFSKSSFYINYLIKFFQNNKYIGCILDIRNNGGGSLSNAIEIANAICNEKKLVLKEFHKSGKGHNDFFLAEEYHTEPSNNFSKPIVILVNRKCYSASSFFCGMVKSFPNILIMGDTTGGGAGLPIDYELPNGWNYRFSTTKSEYLDNDDRFKTFEMGVSPEIVLPELSKDSLKNGKDMWVEEAVNKIILNKNFT